MHLYIWFALALLSAFLFGVDAIFAKLGTLKLGVSRMAVLIMLVDGALYFLGFWYWRDGLAVNSVGAFLATVSCFVGAIAYLCFFESILGSQIAIAGTISAGYPALSVIGGLIFLSETLTATQAISVIAIIGGVIVLSYEKTQDSEYAIPRRSLLFALLALTLWGFWGLTSKMAINLVGPGNIFAFYAISSLIVPLAYVSFRGINRQESGEGNPSWVDWACGVIAIATNAIGIFTFSFALKIGLASLVIPIAGAYPLVTVILAVGLLHEKLGRLQIGALAVVIIGLVMIGIST